MITQITKKTMKKGLAELLFGYQGGDYGLQPVAMVINIFITPVYAHSNLSGIDPCDSHVVKKKKKKLSEELCSFQTAPTYSPNLQLLARETNSGGMRCKFHKAGNKS